MSNSNFNNTLFMHYVIKRASVAGAMSTSRRGHVVPLHKSPTGGLSPMGLILGSAYRPQMEMKTNNDLVREVMYDLRHTDHPINQLNRVELEGKMNFHDGLVAAGAVADHIERGEPAPAPDQWLVHLLREDRGGNNELALLAATRMIARIALRKNG